MIRTCSQRSVPIDLTYVQQFARQLDSYHSRNDITPSTEAPTDLVERTLLSDEQTLLGVNHRVLLQVIGTTLRKLLHEQRGALTTSTITDGPAVTVQAGSPENRTTIYTSPTVGAIFDDVESWSDLNEWFYDQLVELIESYEHHSTSFR